MIEWYGTGGHTADCGDLTLETFGSGFTFRAVVSVNGEPLLDAFDYPTLEDAKAAAETFAREWVAKQAAALGDGWIPVGERLPPSGGTVLAAGFKAGSNVKYQHVAFRDTAGHWKSDDRRSIIGVTHWRPLPPLPAEVEP